MTPPGGGKEPGGVPRGLPGGTEQREGLGGQGDGPVFGALAPMDLALEARALKVGDLQEAGCMEPEAHARDGGAGDLMMEGSGRWQEPPDLLHPEDGGETVGGVRAQERERMPVALEAVWREEADAAVADAQGGGGRGRQRFSGGGRSAAGRVPRGDRAIGGHTGPGGGRPGQRMPESVRPCRSAEAPQACVDAVGS
jgi:hypothetical protein